MRALQRLWALPGVWGSLLCGDLHDYVQMRFSTDAGQKESQMLKRSRLACDVEKTWACAQQSSQLSVEVYSPWNPVCLAQRNGFRTRKGTRNKQHWSNDRIRNAKWKNLLVRLCNLIHISAHHCVLRNYLDISWWVVYTRHFEALRSSQIVNAASHWCSSIENTKTKTFSGLSCTSSDFSSTSHISMTTVYHWERRC